jgi:hypothetical protein
LSLRQSLASHGLTHRLVGEDTLRASMGRLAVPDGRIRSRGRQVIDGSYTILA